MKIKTTNGHILTLMGIFLGIVFVTGCGSAVEEISIEETQVDVDWSAKDLQKIANEMANSIEKDPFTRSEAYKSNKPRWILTNELSNDTDEHINTRIIMEKIRTRLIKRKLARFIDEQAMKKALDQLSIQQTELFDNNQASKLGRFVGAQFILKGRISNLRKRTEDREQVVYYNITLQVVNIETLEIIWTDETDMARRGQRALIRG